MRSFDYYYVAFFVLFLIFAMLFMTVILSQKLGFEEKAEEKCEKLDLELFDYSIGSAFSSSSITCWNPETKEVKIIK